MTLLASAFVMRERITWSGVSGIVLSIIGVMILIFNSVSLREGAAATSVGGIVGMIGNTLSFALYLSIFRPLIRKYSVVTFMKWMFLFSSLYALPFSFSAFSASHLAAVPLSVALQVAYVVVGATFISYFLIPVGQKHLRPVVVSMYTYVQPVVAMVIALSLGLDQLTVLKVVATVLVFTGVGLVNFTPSRTPSTPSVPSAPSTPIK
jgi:drug/metabolite transporter (DMT)-like permease